MDFEKRGRLTHSFHSSLSEIGKIADQYPWEDRYAYAQWLAQTHYFVRHTTVLLTLAAAKYGVRNPDAHAGTLRHLREETGHERVALQDLMNLGYAISDIPELVETSVFYQSQYYWIECYGPLSLAGYAYLLEGTSALHGEKVLKRVEAAHGKNVGSFIRMHVDVDGDHFGTGLERLATATDADLQGVLANLSQSTKLYGNLFIAMRNARAKLPAEAPCEVPFSASEEPLLDIHTEHQ